MMIEDPFYRSAIDTARAGDPDAAMMVFDFFVQDSPYPTPEVVAFVAQCLSAWKDADYDADAAPRCFHTAGGGQQERWDRTKEKHERALAAYFLLRGLGVSRLAAADRAAQQERLRADSILALLKGITVPSKPFTPVQRGAIRELEWKPVFEGKPVDPDHLRRCLGTRVLEKWKRERAFVRERLAALSKEAQRKRGK
jgi:hypothetical protein